MCKLQDIPKVELTSNLAVVAVQLNLFELCSHYIVKFYVGQTYQIEMQVPTPFCHGHVSMSLL